MAEIGTPTPPPLLTVLIPTRNRWSLLRAQAKAVALALGETGVAFEAVVHDNSTTPPPSGLVEGLPPGVRYIRSPELFDTAEENVCEALRHCRGEYVWLLADDDGVELAGVQALVELIRRGEDDIIVFNSRHGRDERLAGDGGYLTERARRLFYEEEMVCPISTFVERTGFFYWICGISTVIVRREIARPEPLRKYLSVARIYAHVAWLIEIGKDRRFRFVNRPLVVYGLLPTDHDGGRHWRSVGVREGGYSQSVWTGLWLRVLDELVAREAITVEQIRRTSEMNHATRFHFGSNLAHQVLEQLGEMPEPTPAEDLAIMSRWLLRLFPGALFLTALLDDIADFATRQPGSLLRIEEDSRFDQAVRAEARDLRARAAWWRHAIGRTSWYARLYVETVRLYDVYDLGSDWVAAHASFGDLGEALEVIDLPSLPPVFLRAPTHEALRRLIEAQPLSAEAIHAVRVATLPFPNEWSRLRPENRAVRVDVAPPIVNLPPPSIDDREMVRLRDELARQDRQLAEVHASRAWRLLGWLRQLGRPAPPSAGRPAAHLDLGAQVSLGDAAADRFLARGFSFPEGWGRWTDGPTAVLRFRHDGSGGAGLLEFWPEMVWTAGGARACFADVSVNGRRGRRIEVRRGEVAAVRVAARDMAAPELEIALRILAPKAAVEEPADEGRALGVGLSAFRLTRLGAAAQA